jgi:hypothetical protein
MWMFQGCSLVFEIGNALDIFGDTADFANRLTY